MRTRQVQRGWGRGVQTTAILYTRVLDIGTAHILGWTVLHWGGCSMHDRMVSIPGLYLLNASSIPIPQVWQLKMSPALARCPLRQKVKPRLRTNALDQRKDFVIGEQFFPFNNTPLASVLGINLWERHRWELGSQEARKGIGRSPVGRWECLEKMGGPGFVGSDQIWDTLNEEPSGFVADEV